MRGGDGFRIVGGMGTPLKPSSLFDVAVPFPVDKLFTYAVPEALRGRVKPGSRVLVPFGPRRVTGYAIAERRRVPGAVKLREIAALVDEEPLLTEELLDLARWMSAYYLHPLGEVLRAVLPSTIKGKGRPAGEDETKGKFPAEIEYPALTPDQAAAFESIRAALDSGASARFLLHGVTGSGKTEVYLRCIEEALRRGKSALVLVPEIALIPQTTSRFRRRFGEAVAVLHSRLSGAQRAALWRGARSGEIRIVIGARSAVFVPLDASRDHRRGRGAGFLVQAGGQAALQRRAGGRVQGPARGRGASSRLGDPVARGVRRRPARRDRLSRSALEAARARDAARRDRRYAGALRDIFRGASPGARGMRRAARAGGRSPQQARARELRPVPRRAAGSSSAPTAPSRSRSTAAARSSSVITAGTGAAFPTPARAAGSTRSCIAGSARSAWRWSS